MVPARGRRRCNERRSGCNERCAMPCSVGYSACVLRRLAIPLVACGLLGLLDTAHYSYYLHDSGKGIDVVHALLRESPAWIAWALAVPFVLRWGERFRLEWPP